MPFLPILEVINCHISKFEQFFNTKFTKFQNSESEIAKNDIFGRFELTKM